MTGAERSTFDAHAAWLRDLPAYGVLIVSDPCPGQVNTSRTALMACVVPSIACVILDASNPVERTTASSAAMMPLVTSAVVGTLTLGRT